MDINETPRANRIHIGIFGRRNAGKSSLINAITNQDIAIVSNIKGTTTDPVYKAMELLPIGPVILIDTPGLDDNSNLGKKRVKRADDTLKKSDIALIVVSADTKDLKFELEIIEKCKKNDIPYIIVINKIDKYKDVEFDLSGEKTIRVSAKTTENINALKDMIANLKNNINKDIPLISDFINKKDNIILVVPIDKAAPKGRLILPQQQVIREILDCNANVTITKENSLKSVIDNMAKKPNLVITDSQVFDIVDKNLEQSIPLTSFSILFARKKGILKDSCLAIKTIENINDNDKILICEGCTHHRQCDDIGSVLIPKLIKKHTNKNPIFEFTSGIGFKEDLREYKLIVHCGGCMLNNKEVINRLKLAKLQGVPFTNYGIALAYLKGVLKRSIYIFKDIYNEF